MRAARRLAAALFAATVACGSAAASGATPDESPIPKATPASQWHQTGGGRLAFRINDFLFQRFGASLRFAGRATRDGEYITVPLRRDAGLTLDAPYGAVRGTRASALRADRVRLELTRGTRRIVLDPLEFTAVPESQGRLELSVRNARGVELFHVGPVMHELVDASGGLRIVTADLTIAPALAQWLGEPRYAGITVADLRLDTALRALDPPPAAPKTCNVPVWPGTPGTITDVSLISMQYLAENPVQMVRCRRTDLPGNACDGPGGNEGDLVIAPNARLRNSSAVNASDVPWCVMFQGPGPCPYPVDQHPFLVWNAYRIDAAGRIEQIGRSAVKHAFLSGNEQCTDTTCSASNVLGRGCADTYNIGSNELNTGLGPRRDIIPSTGQFGRCMSIFDDTLGSGSTPGCDGQRDETGNDLYSNRLVARESAVDPSQNDGAAWWFEAWYVIRDDQNIYNTMGHVGMTPQWTGAVWVYPTPAGGAFVQGPVLNRWVDPAEAGNTRNIESVTPNGRMRLAVRVRPDVGGWRYDYALMNFDFARVTTSGTEPNLQVLENRGLTRLSVPLGGTASASALETGDGDASAANDWISSIGAGAVAWDAPAGVSLSWGSLIRFAFVSNKPPAEGTVTLSDSGPGVAGDYPVLSLVPDGDALLVDGFEGG